MRQVMDQDDTTHPRCGARKRQGGAPCGRPAGAGTRHPGVGRCKLHGGCTPNHDLAAARATLDEVSSRLALPDPLPHEALLACVRIAAAQVVYCTERVGELDVADAFSSRRPHPWIALRSDTVELLARVSKMAIDAKVDDRVARQADDAARLIVTAVSSAVEDVGLTDDQTARLRDTLPARLAALEADAHDMTTTERNH